MSANESNLSNKHFGYDFVVATTQESINGTMKEYLYNSTFPVVQLYWNQDDKGNPVAISRDDLLKETNGTDPLTVPSWNSDHSMTPAIEDINNSNFYFAFEAAIGIPSGIAPQDIPDIITLQPASESVSFNLICAQFTVVTCNFGRKGLTSFVNASQPTDTPWLFTSQVALKQIFNNSNLPAAVQAQLNNLGPDAFSVQQLFFDLDNAFLESIPKISGVDPSTPAYTILGEVFLGAYFTAMKNNALPILNYSIVQNKPDNDPSTLKLTKMEMEVSPYTLTPGGASTNDLNTLCYLCETNGGNLPPAVPFNWRWVDQSEESSFDGVVSINRNTLAQYFEDQLTKYVSLNCFSPWVRVWLSDAGFTTNYAWSMTPGQTPTITKPETNSVVLNYSYNPPSADDNAGLDGDMGAMGLSTSYSASVVFTGTTIVVTQNLVVRCYIRALQSSEEWNAINKTITDTYTLSVDKKGDLTASLLSVTVNNSDPTPSPSWLIKLFTGLKHLVNDIADWANSFATTSFHSMPLSVANQFVFPGGKTFTFKDVNFSANQDLVSHISYVKPKSINKTRNLIEKNIPYIQSKSINTTENLKKKKVRSAPKISISTELMKNYKQTLLMSPENKFEALQTSIGNSLLFSIGTDNAFYVTQECVGHATGWEKTDLSRDQVAKSFPGKTGLICKTFDAAQSAVDGTIGLAMVINDGTNDHLFLCLGNCNADTSWVTTPGWTQYPFDNPAKNITIVGVFLSETANNTQYIVVDILRDPTSPKKLISRYYINTQGTPAWLPHDVAIDLEANSYTSCLGRQYLPNSPHQPTIDGLYTSGQIDGKPQLIFQPLYNVFNTKIPAPIARLQLPGDLVADSIASCRKSDMSTELYACSGGGLYYFASNNQADETTGVLLTQNTMFDGVRKMYAAQSNNTSIVWGLNGNNEIFYTSCPVGQETASPSAWSYPLPILAGVDLFSPYINRVDDGNTFFAVAGSTLQKLIKSTKNTTWTSQSITLPSPNTTDTQKYSSYTTRIQVTDDNNQLLVNETISISASTRTGVYINHLYYVVDSTGIQIKTDELGSITVVEWITSLTGTRLNVSDSSGNSTAVNPMDKPMSKIAQLNTVDSLKNAIITNADGSTQPLVGSSVSGSDLQTVATLNGQLSNVYNTLSPSGSSGLPSFTLLAQGVNSLGTPTAFNVDGIDALWVDAGDLLSWLESGVEAVIQIVENAAQKAWVFIAKIAGEVYAAVLDAVEKVAAAAVWVFNLIKTAIEDLILFLEFLFEFQDILVTHRVMKNVFTQWVGQSIDSLSSLKTDVSAAFIALQDDVNKWADIPNFNQTPSSTKGSNPPLNGQNSAPAQLGIHHYQGNAGSSSSSFSSPSIGEEIFQDLLNLLDSEEATLTAAYDAIKTDIIDQFDSLSVTQIIQKFIAIVVDTLLQTTENILLAAINVFVQLAEGFLDLLTAPIDIPVISWLYKELTGDDLSILDLFCFIAAIPATIVYKIAKDVAPFPKGDAFTNGLLDASSFEQVQSQFFTAPSQMMSNVAGVTATNDSPVLDNARLKKFGFVSGIFAAVGSIGLVVVTALQRASENNPEGFAATWPKTLALLGAIANVAYVSPNIATFINVKTGTWWQQMNNAITVISIMKGFANVTLATLPSRHIAPKISSGLESVINLVWNVPVIVNIIENKDDWNTTYKSLIPESVGNFAFNLGGMLDFPIAMAKEPPLPAYVVQYGLMISYGGLIAAAGGINQYPH
jgi:hypothetical protein